MTRTILEMHTGHLATARDFTAARMLVVLEGKVWVTRGQGLDEFYSAGESFAVNACTVVESLSQCARISLVK